MEEFSAPMPVAAFMPTLNEADGVADAVRSLDRQTHPVSSLTVVDGGSDDGTLDELEQVEDEVSFRVDIVVIEGGGARYSSQVGAERAIERVREEADDGVVVRIEGDSAFSEEFVKEAVDRLQDGAACFGAKVEPKEDDGMKEAIAFLQNLDRYPKGRGMAFRASDFEAVGGYRLEGETTEDIQRSDVNCLGDTILTGKLRERGAVAFSHAASVASTVPSTTLTSLDRWSKRLLLETRIGPRFDLNRPLQHVRIPAERAGLDLELRDRVDDLLTEDTRRLLGA